MVEIQCPHCEEDIELEDGASGLFDCPHCDEEFSWGSDTEVGENSRNIVVINFIVKWGTIIGFGLIFLALIALGLVSILSIGDLHWDIFVGFAIFIFFSVIIGGSLVIIALIFWIIRKMMQIIERGNNR